LTIEATVSDEQARVLPHTDVGATSAWHPPAEDPLLESFVSMCDRSDMEVGITLTIGGSTITGRLVAAKEYRKEFGRLMARLSGVDPDSAEGAEVVATFSPDEASPVTGLDPEVVPLAEHPGYLHLKQARVSLGPDLAPAEGVLWRGRISRVDGWSLGHLRPGGR
jgi:hypothetical protein